MKKKILIITCLLQVFIIVLLIYKLVWLYDLIYFIDASPIDDKLYTYAGEYELTFYTHTGNLTSTGTHPTVNHTVAVDPKIIPYGTAIYIEGYGIFFAEDCGADIQGHRLDIFVDTQEEAIHKGRQKANVYILQDGQ